MSKIYLFLIIFVLIAVIVLGGIFMYKMYKKLKKQELLLEQANESIAKSIKLLTDAVSKSVVTITEKTENIINESKEEFNNNSTSVENTLISGGFKEVK